MRKHDEIRNLGSQVEYWKERVATVTTLREAEQTEVNRLKTELANARAEVKGYIITWEVTTTTYERDEDGLKEEVDNDVREFKTVGDAVHFSRSQRLFYSEVVDGLVLVTMREIKTKRTALNSDGEPFNRGSGIEYGLFGNPYPMMITGNY